MTKEKLTLKSPIEIYEVLKESGATDLDKMKSVLCYIDKLHRTILNYQSFVDQSMNWIENRNEDVSM